MKPILKISAWFVVCAVWLLYGLVILETLLHPRKEAPINPVEEWQQNLQLMRHDWGITLFLVCGIVLYAICWDYIKTNRKDKQ